MKVSSKRPPGASERHGDAGPREARPAARRGPARQVGEDVDPRLRPRDPRSDREGAAAQSRRTSASSPATYPVPAWRDAAAPPKPPSSTAQGRRRAVAVEGESRAVRSARRASSSSDIPRLAGPTRAPARRGRRTRRRGRRGRPRARPRRSATGRGRPLRRRRVPTRGRTRPGARDTSSPAGRISPVPPKVMRSPFITTAPRFQRSWRADLPPRGEGARVEGTLAPPGGLRVDAPVVVHRERVDAGEGGELARVPVGFARVRYTR